MSDSVLTGGTKLMRALDGIAKRMADREVAVGFMSGATYPNGTPVAAIAFWNEYGKSDQPARPFFRRMIAKESPGWALKMARLARATNYDGGQVLALMGEDIKGALQQSINDFQSPPLNPRTVEAKGFAKPLIDTSHMLNSISYEVTE